MREEAWQETAQLQGKIFKSYDVAGRGRGTKRGVGERGNAVEYKTNTQPGNRAFCNETKYKVTAKQRMRERE